MATESFVKFDPKTKRLLCQGDWHLATLVEIEAELCQIAWPGSGTVIIDGSNIKQLDSAAALLLSYDLKKKYAKNVTFKFESFSVVQQKLLTRIADKVSELKPVKEPDTLSFIPRLGKRVIMQWDEVKDFFAFIGELSIDALWLLRNPKQMRWRALANIVQTSGFNALFIIALLSLMIGIVITYQMGLQLRNYGANIFIVDLLGLSILREFAPLLTAIMIAGRTGSAFTAQIGTMKVNQEIDALNTMGVKPTVLLILPRILGLIIALPLLTMWADIFGIFGGMLMAGNMLDIDSYNFLHRFQHVIALKTFVIGIGKTPVFAMLIASIGCYQGMKVQGSADSVGKQTTKSVVLAIFCIIVVDAIFSIVFSKLKL